MRTRALSVPAELGGTKRIILRVPAIAVACVATTNEARTEVEFGAPTLMVAADTFRNAQPFNRMAFGNRFFPVDAPRGAIDARSYGLSVSRLRFVVDVEVSRAFFVEGCGGGRGSAGRPLAKARYLAKAMAKLKYHYKVERELVTRQGGTRWTVLRGEGVVNPVVQEESDFTYHPEEYGPVLSLRDAESRCQEPHVGTTYGKCFRTAPSIRPSYLTATVQKRMGTRGEARSSSSGGAKPSSWKLLQVYTRFICCPFPADDAAAHYLARFSLHGIAHVSASKE